MGAMILLNPTGVTIDGQPSMAWPGEVVTDLEVQTALTDRGGVLVQPTTGILVASENVQRMRARGADLATCAVAMLAAACTGAGASAGEIAYTPSDLLAWDSMVPTTVQEGLDNLAAINAMMPITTQRVYVAHGGDDAHGNGSMVLPYLTIAKAMSSITDNSITKRYEIQVGPGQHPEVWGLKPWVAVVGAATPSNGATPDGAMLTEITAPADTIGYDASWTAALGFGIAFVSYLGFTNHQTWDEGTNVGIQPQINFEDCSFNDGASLLGPGNLGFDNFTFVNCISYGGFTVRGCQYLWLRLCVCLGGTVTVQAGPAGATTNTTLLAENCTIGSVINPTALTVKWAAPSPAGVHALAIIETTNHTGTLTLDGAHTSFVQNIGYTSDVHLVNGATGYNGTVLGAHLVVQGRPPVATPGAAAGLSATATTDLNSTSPCGLVTVATGTGTTTGVLADITYNVPYATGQVPFVSISRGDAQAVGQFYVGNLTNTGFTIYASTAPSVSQSYVFTWIALATAQVVVVP